MKKTLLILSIITLFFVGCKKDDIAEASKVRIETETIEKGWDYVKINVEYDYPVALEAVSLYLSEKEDMSDANVYECNVEGKKYSVELDSLKAGVAYYYCYEYDNGYEKVRCDVDGLMIITTKEVTNIKATTATCGGNVTFNGNAMVTARGICWSTKPNPTISDSKTTDGSGTGSFTSYMSGLQDGTTYYVRAYATNEKGTAYGEEKSFTTLELLLPTVMTENITNIKTNSSRSGGNVSSDGNGTVTARGICWSTKPNPTISDSKTTDGSGIGSYTSNLSNLASQTTYYVRAYAINEKGTSYGEQKNFTTLDKYSGHEYVDLGLPSGLLWATCNVGADSPEEYGDYFAWGETTNYSSLNSATCGLSISQLQSQGYIDGAGNLNPQYDAATANWGGNWRMPTYDEMQELIDNCTWTWTTQNGVSGYNGEGPNGNSIFLPAAGFCSGSSLCYAGSYGDYWSSTPYEYGDLSSYSLCFGDGGQTMNCDGRYYGYCVRPILE